MFMCVTWRLEAQGETGRGDGKKNKKSTKRSEAVCRDPPTEPDILPRGNRKIEAREGKGRVAGRVWWVLLKKPSRQGAPHESRKKVGCFLCFASLALMLGGSPWYRSYVRGDFSRTTE